MHRTTPTHLASLPPALSDQLRQALAATCASPRIMSACIPKSSERTPTAPCQSPAAVLAPPAQRPAAARACCHILQATGSCTQRTHAQLSRLCTTSWHGVPCCEAARRGAPARRRPRPCSRPTLRPGLPRPAPPGRAPAPARRWARPRSPGSQPARRPAWPRPRGSSPEPACRAAPRRRSASPARAARSRRLSARPGAAPERVGPCLLYGSNLKECGIKKSMLCRPAPGPRWCMTPQEALSDD